MPADPYAYWRDALARNFTNWENDLLPQAGWYRVRFGKRELHQPVAVLVGCEAFLIGREQHRREASRCLRLWEMARDNPVSEAAYSHAVAHGNWWDSIYDAAGNPVADLLQARPMMPPGRA